VSKKSSQGVAGRKRLDGEDFEVSSGDAASIGTLIVLSGLTNSARERFPDFGDLEQAFSVQGVRSHVLVTFLQRLVGLRSEVGKFEIQFSYIGPNEVEEKECLRSDDLPTASECPLVSVEERDARSGDLLGRSQELSLCHYKLDSEKFNLPRNTISLCARSSPVLDITSRYLRTKAEIGSSIDGFHHIVLIEGEVLDRCVNERRDGFDGIPGEIPSDDLFSQETVSFDSIFEKIDPIIENWVSPASWSRESVLDAVAATFGISPSMLADTESRVRYGDTARSVAERVLKKYQERIVGDTAHIVDLKQEILASKPDSDEYRKKIDELTWRYTASLKAFDMANLSQLVVRRAAIVEVLEMASVKSLLVQSVEAERRRDERIIHSIFFPMGRDSKDAQGHDIWLLGEEYQYFSYVASDKRLADIRWSEDEPLFDSGIDYEVDAVFRRRTSENGAKRPDLAIFSEEGSVVIVEFKSPGVSLDEHIGDISEYAHLLAAKSRGRLKKFFGYLIGDGLNPLRMQGWTKFPAGNGFFRTNPLVDPDSGRILGSLYEETVLFSQVVERARKRLQAFKERLKISFE
jgi:hypothetical protein